MVTYKERKQNQQNFVLLKDGVPLATFGNLKKITEWIEDDNFPSYWTLIRKKEFPLKLGPYCIYKVRHH
ncbi:hypothetical protein [uncultured Croceitalea sp.]|uniref:hypothetical protein n=1 Tax=uncultured Croceitalea sp. TaxID=1798908 RepID=UPI0033057704